MPLTIPGIPQEYLDLIVGVVTAVVILIVGLIVAGWANALVARALHKRKVDDSLVGFLASLARWLVLAASIIIALERVGLQTTSLVALLGSAGIAIGLALQGNLAHFASGVMILLFRPFKGGDYIEVADKQGWVTAIGLFTTTLLTLDSETIIIPNSSVTGNVMTNYSASGKRRAHIAVGVAYGSKVSEVVVALQKAAARCETVMQDPKPVIAFVGLGASSLDFLILAHCDPARYPDCINEVHTAAYEELEAAGIEIPFTQIVLHQAKAS